MIWKLSLIISIVQKHSKNDKFYINLIYVSFVMIFGIALI